MGRSRELRRLADLLALARSGPSVAWVAGPEGVGKSALVRRFLNGIEAGGGRTVWVDGEDGRTGRRRIATAIASSAKSGDPGLGSTPEADVLVLDGFDALADWTFRHCIDSLGSRLLVVVTTRDRPRSGLRALLATSTAFDELVLTDFDEEETACYLRQQGVPEAAQASLLALTRGHPRALALAAERPRTDGAEALVEALAREYLAGLTTPHERDASYVLALARTTDEEVLAAVLPTERVFETYQHLAQCALVQTTKTGLVPHPLRRAVTHRDFLARSPRRADALGERVANFYIARMATADGIAQVRHDLLDALFARRHASDAPGSLRMETDQRTHVRLASRAEFEALAGHVERLEGGAAARAFLRFAERQPDGVHVVVVDREPEVVGIVFPLLLSRCAAEDLALDPVVRTIHAFYVANDGCAEADVQLFRWVLTTRSGDAPDAHTLSVMTVAPFLAARAADRIRWTTCSLAARWTAVADAFGWSRLREDVCSRALFVKDLRECVGEDRDPLRALEHMLLDLLRRFGVWKAPETTALVTRDEFDERVRDVLEKLHAPLELDESRFLDTVVGRAAVASGGVVGLLEDVLAELEGSRDYAGAAQVLRVTFFDRAEKQEAAAAALGIPFGTYRYRLRKAIACFATALWRRESFARSARGVELRIAPHVRHRFDID